MEKSFKFSEISIWTVGLLYVANTGTNARAFFIKLPFINSLMIVLVIVRS